jgi:hypothetical protein
MISMPTSRAEQLRGGIAARLIVIVLGLGGLQSCGLLHHDEGPGRVVPTDVAAEIEHVLNTRGRALVSGQRQLFLATVNRADRTLTSRERRYFDNLQELPIRRLYYRLDRGSMVDTGDGVTAVVRRELQLTSYDALPVNTPDRMHFVMVDGRYVIANDQDHAWQDANMIEIPPWDSGRIEVRSSGGVLGVFDKRSVGQADAVLADVQHGIDEVAAIVPLDWSRQVVVYALSDTAAIQEINDLPGGDPEQLDGVAFPVQSGPRSDRLAATRFVLHPRMLTQTGLARQRLIRHELTHVAVGELDDHVPIWLSEGLAEWVSVQTIPMSERVISEAAVTAARAGVRDLPDDDTFNGPHSGANYGLAWWACDWIATTYSPEMLWTLLDTMAAGDGTTEAEQDDVLQQLLGIDSHDLARHAAQRILTTFG